MMNRRSKITGRSSGFTLIELLIAIGIIGVLIAMFAIGSKAIRNNMKTRSTRATLGTAMGLQAEFEATSGKIDGMFQWSKPTARVPPVDVSNGYWEAWPSPSPVKVSSCSVDATAGRIVDVTARIQSHLERVPKNKEAVQKIAASGIMARDFPDIDVMIPPGDESYWGVPVGTATVKLPVGRGTLLLDAWSNPLRFIPGGGITNVNVGGQANQTIKSPDGRPFWVSAGPDGNLQNGDDNVYSFEN